MPMQPAPSSSSTGIIVGVLVAVVVLVGVMASLALFGFRSYMAKAKAIASATAVTAPALGVSPPPVVAGASGTLLSSTDGKVQIRVPESWTIQTNINDQAMIQAGDLAREEYVLVIADAKVDLAPNVDLGRYAELVVSNMRARPAVSNLKVLEASPTTVGTQKALRYDITATVDSTNIGYEYLIVEGSDRYYQVMTWTLLSQFEDKKPIFRAATATFRAP